MNPRGSCWVLNQLKPLPASPAHPQPSPTELFLLSPLELTSAWDPLPCSTPIYPAGSLSSRLFAPIAPGSEQPFIAGCLQSPPRSPSSLEKVLGSVSPSSCLERLPSARGLLPHVFWTPGVWLKTRCQSRPCLPIREVIRAAGKQVIAGVCVSVCMQAQTHACACVYSVMSLPSDPSQPHGL